jgi:hypothetical protein
MTALAQTPPVQPLSIGEMGKVCAEHIKYGFEELKEVLGEFSIGTQRASANMTVDFTRKGFTVVNAFMVVCKEYAQAMIRRMRAKSAEAGGNMGGRGGRAGDSRRGAQQPQTKQPNQRNQKPSVSPSLGMGPAGPAK